MDGALDVILGRPVDRAVRDARSCTASWSGSTRRRKTVDRLAKGFRRDYQIMPLVEAIAHDDAFVSDAAVRAKYRTPVEKLVGIMQATGGDTQLASPDRPRARRGTTRPSATRCAR